MRNRKTPRLKDPNPYFDITNSYTGANGVMHNPRADNRLAANNEAGGKMHPWRVGKNHDTHLKDKVTGIRTYVPGAYHFACNFDDGKIVAGFDNDGDSIITNRDIAQVGGNASTFVAASKRIAKEDYLHDKEYENYIKNNR